MMESLLIKHGEAYVPDEKLEPGSKERWAGIQKVLIWLSEQTGGQCNHCQVTKVGVGEEATRKFHKSVFSVR